MNFLSNVLLGFFVLTFENVMSWKAFKNELAILDPEKDTFGVPQDSDEGAVD